MSTMDMPRLTLYHRSYLLLWLICVYLTFWRQPNLVGAAKIISTRINCSRKLKISGYFHETLKGSSQWSGRMYTWNNWSLIIQGTCHRILKQKLHLQPQDVLTIALITYKIGCCSSHYSLYWHLHSYDLDPLLWMIVIKRNELLFWSGLWTQ